MFLCHNVNFFDRNLPFRSPKERITSGYAASTALPISYHPLASPFGGGGRPNGLTERAAARPVAALTVHRTVIHYRDFASLTPKGRAK